MKDKEKLEKMKSELEKMAKEMEPLVEKAKKYHEEMMSQNIMKMTKEELLKIENFYNKKKFNAIVIVPTGELHESDFECMKYILLDHFEIVGAVSGWSDVVHVDGIGGYGKNLSDYGKLKKARDLNIDCLPKSHCLRLFSMSQYFELDDFIGSDFIFYFKD